ncbi:hypothetical protein DIPPA_00319 [Diplonema papillatum]|nr:hypothetical protein DIPPA_00319 [Diplonema papillatum]
MVANVHEMRYLRGCWQPVQRCGAGGAADRPNRACCDLLAGQPCLTPAALFGLTPRQFRSVAGRVFRQCNIPLPAARKCGATLDQFVMAVLNAGRA